MCRNQLLTILICTVIPMTSFSQQAVPANLVNSPNRVAVKGDDGTTYYIQIDKLNSAANPTNPANFKFFSNSQLIDEADLSKEQRTQLNKIKENHQNQVLQLVEKFKRDQAAVKTEAERRKLKIDFSEQLISIQRKTSNAIESKLIPFQTTILKREKFRRLSLFGIYRAILENPFVEELKLSEKQNDQIRKVGESTEKEIADFVAKARERAKKKIMKLLDSEQQEYIEILTENQK